MLEFRVLAVIIFGCFEVLLGGLGLGWPSLVYMLKHEGFFIEKCSSNSTILEVNCKERDTAFNLVFSVSMGLAGFGGLFSGFILDKFGLFWSRISQFLPLLLCYGLLSSRIVNGSLLFISIISLNFSNIQILNNSTVLANLVPQYKSIIISIFSCMFNTSIAVADVIKIIYERGIEMYKIFLFLSGITVIQLTASGLLMPYNKPLDENFETLIEKFQKKKDSVPDLAIGMRQACQSTLEIVSVTAVKKDKFLDFRNFLQHFKKQKKKLRETLSNKLYLLTVMFEAVNHLNVIYYISSLNSVIEDMADNNSELVSWHISLFSYIQYANVIVALFIGWIIEKADKSNNRFAFSLMTLVCIISGSSIVLIVTIKVLNLQVVGYFGFLLARILTYSLPPVIFLRWLDNEHFGMAMGSCQVILSAFGLMANPLYRLNVEVFRKNNFYKIVKVIPSDQQHLEWLKDVYKQEKVDFLIEPSVKGVPCEVLLSPQQQIPFERSLNTFNFQYEESNADVESDLQTLWSRLDNNKNFNLDDFNDFDTIMDGLDEMQSRCPNGASCSIRSIGNSHEGRLQKVFELTKEGNGRKIIWIDSAIHAREWLSAATVLNILNTLIEQSDQDAINLFNKYDFYFLPVVNPDGYQYTFDYDRFWRKNRRQNPGGCFGIDLNRNYDSRWGTDGVSTNPCSQTYPGASVASERETVNVQNEALRIGSNTLAWITTHTFGQMVLTPFSYTEDGICYRSDDYAELKRSADAFANGIEEVYGTSWVRGSFCEVLYPGSGTLVDYVKEKAGVKYSYTPELRGPGFDPSRDQIQPSYNEFWNGFKKLIAEIEAIEGLN
ncbi:DgyrCDS12968 [Dimorphilus gyrociliatus]|uniref:DgyrCDS12968 n=1 Tax=Dimorphilus gyrociliatus TaxID=2664684 RepID=A0A7I8W998_9ANNE|nr:DgyrCDS12968 [Dimorphilus gyrociliatus]